ncbi:MAG: putative transcriptional regulator [Candidatus Pseudothioglobus sp.]|jgi:putative transcriptional regulator
MTAFVNTSGDSAFENFKNQLLVAIPSAFHQDDYFDQSVSLIIDHSPQGAFGLMINRPLTRPISELLVDVPKKLHCPVFDGGPVERDRLFFLHSGERQYPGTRALNNDIHLTACDELIDDLIKGFSPTHINAYLGYAGWGAAQLETEIAESIWLLTPCSTSIVFSTPVANRRTEAAKLLGIDLHLTNWSAGHD